MPSTDAVDVFVSGSTQQFITAAFLLPGTTTPRDLTGWVGTMHYRLDGRSDAPLTITGAQVVGAADGTITVTPNPDEITDEGYYTARIVADDVNPNPTVRVATKVFRFRVDPVLPVTR